MKKTQPANSGPHASESERLDRAAQVYAELVAFCYAKGAPCFVGWPEDILTAYLQFHALNRSLAYVRDPHTKAVIGLAIGWQCRPENIGKHWQTHDATARAFYFSQLVCSAPGALRSLVHEFRKRFPQWQSWELYATRGRKGVVKYKPKFIERLEQQ